MLDQECGSTEDDDGHLLSHSLFTFEFAFTFTFRFAFVFVLTFAMLFTLKCTYNFCGYYEFRVPIFVPTCCLTLMGHNDDCAPEIAYRSDVAWCREAKLFCEFIHAILHTRVKRTAFAQVCACTQSGSLCEDVSFRNLVHTRYL